MIQMIAGEKDHGECTLVPLLLPSTLSDHLACAQAQQAWHSNCVHDCLGHCKVVFVFAAAYTKMYTFMYA